MTSSDSTRFILQMIMNVFICNYAKKRLVKMTSRKEGKRSAKSYLTFMVFVVMLVGLNQMVYFAFKDYNLYQELGISRSMAPDSIKKYQEELKIKIMTNQNMELKYQIENVKKIQSMVHVLTHPARRLSYDTFGETDTQYAWAFKNQYFLLSTIISSSIFYIICTFINLVGGGKGQVQQSFKMEIMVMILLFLWQVQIIMKTQSRMNSYTDSLDSLYTAFPIFERRQMIKIILIPSMNILKFFFRFLIQSTSQKKFLKIAKHPQLKKITSKISDSVMNKVKNVEDQHFEDRVQVVLTEEKKKNQLATQIYAFQRKALHGLIFTEGDNILLDDEISMLLRYFMIK